MNKRAQRLLELASSGYGLGFVVSMVISAFLHRYDCYVQQGVVGIFWCDLPSTASWIVIVAKSLIWPYYLYQSVT